MVRLQIISGRMAGTETVARHFPFLIGRAQECQLQLHDDGVWDRHCQFGVKFGEGFFVESLSEALVVINGNAASDRRLRNGDTIDVGAAKIRFWLSDTRQKQFIWREWATWLAFLAVFAAEIYLIYTLSA